MYGIKRCKLLIKKINQQRFFTIQIKSQDPVNSNVTCQKNFNYNYNIRHNFIENSTYTIIINKKIS